MYNVQCTMYVVHCTLYLVYCTLYTLYIVHCTLSTIHCTLYIVFCTLYTVHCTLYTVQCTVYTVHYCIKHRLIISDIEILLFKLCKNRTACKIRTNVRYTMCIVHCTVNNVYICAVYTVRCTVCSI